MKSFTTPLEMLATRTGIALLCVAALVNEGADGGIGGGIAFGT